MIKFNLAENLKELADDDPLSVISKDTPKEQIFEAIRPILQHLINKPELSREACLKRIDTHFSLSQEEAKALRRDFKTLYKSKKEPQENDKGLLTALGHGIIDIVEHDGLPAFLTTDGEVVRQISLEDKNYCPPAKEALPFLLPRADAVLEAIELDTDGQLYHDIRDYIYSISDLPGDTWYDLLTAWVLHTYLIEKSEYSPLIWFYAVPERGKSRTGKALIYLAYRGLHVESLRDAYLVRVTNDMGASLFFDVAELWKKAERNGTEDLLLQRYERGARVPRVLYPERGAHRDIVYYSIFGPTLVATNETVSTALDSRAIQINMQPATRNFTNDVTPELALPLKERLVAFRFRHMTTTTPDVEKPSSGRLGDILKPLSQIIRLVQPDREAAFTELAREIEERRGIDRGETIEAKLVKAIVDLKDAVEYGRLAIKRISDKFNEGTPEKYQSRPETISRKLVALGFVRVRVHGGKRSIVYDEILVKNLALTYLKLASPPSPLTQGTTGAGFKGDANGDANFSIQEPSPEPSPRKVNNHAGFVSGDGGDANFRVSAKKKKKSLFLRVDDDAPAQEGLPWR